MKWFGTTVGFVKKTPVLEAVNPSVADLCPNRVFTVRIYYYHPQGKNVEYSYNMNLGIQQITYAGQGTETITETIKYTRGKGSRSKTTSGGLKDIFRSDLQQYLIWFEPITYVVSYVDFSIRVVTEGNKAILFYYAPNQGETENEFESLFEFTVAPCGICNAENLDQCSTAQDCTGAGGYWYDDACHVDPETPPEPVCSLEHPELCLTQQTCEAIEGLSWWQNACHVGEVPTVSETFRIREHGTTAYVSGASVYIDSVYKGTTDNDGYITVTGLTPGTHTIKVTKSGFQDSDDDDLLNDEFEITV